MTPQPWTPRNSINLALACLAGAVLALVPIFWSSESWAPAAEMTAGALLIGLLTPGSPVGRVLDAVAGRPDAAAAEAVRDALSGRRDATARGRHPAPIRREDGSTGLELLGAVVCAGIGAAILIARGL